MAWLAASHPDLVGRYRRLYGCGAYLPASYQRLLRERTAPLIAKHRLGGEHRRFGMPAAAAGADAAAAPVQARLF